VIDVRLLRTDPDAVRVSQRTRGEDESLVDVALDLEERRRSALTRFEQLRAEQKDLGRQVAKSGGAGRAPLLERAKGVADQVKAAQADADAAEAQLDEVLWRIPNVVIEGVPAGGEDDFEVLRSVGAPRDLAAEYGPEFTVRDHLELGELLAAIDVERGTKVSGARFYFLTGVGARLELALLNAAMDRAIAAGFVPMITPTLVRPEIMRGTGFLGAHADEVYHLATDDLYLVGTSEVALGGYHADEIVDLSAGPLRYAGWSSCFRREAGSYGKDTRGIIRVHQFNKVEMYVYTTAEDAEAEHDRLLAFEEEMLGLVEVPYRVIDTAAGDLGASAARKFDCEAWLPSQQRYLELTSTSNCTTFQARRLGIRERTPSGQTRTVATLNGTLATTRWIVAILENHQQADGAVRVPEGLRGYLGGLEVLEPASR
jgi:seryl-tRNA synthetase